MTHAAYQLFLTPLSPVHIGTGDAYEPTSYVIQEHILYAFDSEAAYHALNPQERERLLHFTARVTPESVLDIHKFFYERRETLIPFAHHFLPVPHSIAEQYENRISQPAQTEASRDIFNQLSIDRMATNPSDHSPVLFGSSLKGAIRTALLDKVNNGQDHFTKKEKEKKEAGLHPFQGDLFRYLNEREKPAFERDPLRLIHVADARYRIHDLFAPARVYFAVNRRKRAGTSPRNRESLYQRLECACPLVYRAFEGQISFQVLSGIQAHDELPSREFWFGMQDVALACNRFYRPLFEKEMNLLRNRRMLDEGWAQSMESLLTDSRLQNGSVFLLRVGRHSGAEAVTLNGVRWIRIIQGRNNPPTYDKEPHTLWLAAEDLRQTEGHIPFGWILAEAFPFEAPAPEDGGLKKIFEPFMQDLRQKGSRLSDIQKALKEARAKILEQHELERKEEERRREERARQEQERAEREARLAAMTEEERAIETFRACFEQNKQGPYKKGSLFDQERLNFFNRMQTVAEVRTLKEAAKLLQETIDWGQPKKERKRDFLAWIKKAMESETPQT